ncbi:glyoxylate/hydroxypyruvate reductase HPR3-like [Andrographis paniculata]|uniref:glyoxylate/hydroxypyruvate reductase HPR3-like n=1 Tax=Andrographis paniculata TaxID=175694 RepID=UPI0021E95A49|nr:glyoxylate/hydroxypyruvate reductase HPR3-like [Andrographis paniculata]
MDQERRRREPPPAAGEERQQLLILRPPQLFIVYEQEFSDSFNLLKAYESPLPTDIFLHKYAQSTRVVFCSGLSPITNDILHHLPSLQLVAAASTGVNHIDLAACRRRGIAVTNTADVFSEDTADYAVGILIGLIRKISGGDSFVRRRLWPLAGEYPFGFTLKNKRVGIVGLGNIGSKVAKRLESLGCKISYNSRTKNPSASHNFYPTACELASHSDILVICCTLTDDSRHIINDDVMAALGENGFIVNIARGPVVDERALVKRLLEGTIAGAGLDVFENEPAVPQELLRLDNVVLSPHRAGFTREAFAVGFRMVMDNLNAFFSGEPLISPIINLKR